VLRPQVSFFEENKIKKFLDLCRECSTAYVVCLFILLLALLRYYVTWSLSYVNFKINVASRDYMYMEVFTH